jgi:hypothetical protein
MPPVLYCRTQAETRLIARLISGGEFRACAQLFFFILFAARMFRPKAPDVSPRGMSSTTATRNRALDSK